MSRYHGNDDECGGCGITYREFRTGFTYQDVKMMFWDDSDDPDDWTYKRRGTVLGKWHQIKREAWDEHVERCEADALAEAS